MPRPPRRRLRDSLFGSHGLGHPILIGASAATLAAGVLVPVTMTATAAAAGDRTETPVITTSPITSVLESVVSIKSPLPASDGPHPANCDWLSYLRYRDANGPADYTQADKILIAQPGIYEGAGAFDSVARNTVVAAAAQGKHIEFWALDRRSNCLEDRTGIQAALDSHNYDTAIDYYYGGATVNGQKFSGFVPDSQLGWLANVGIEQTVRDEYAVMTQAISSQPLRKAKFLCGGHSLGGIVTGFFAKWDFDGNAATTDDAGYNQCGGYFALDTTISTSLSSLAGMPQPDGVAGWLVSLGGTLGYTFLQAALWAGIAPRTLALPVVINPETMNLLSVVGTAADIAPDTQTDLTVKAPNDFDVNTTLQFLLSKDALTFLTANPSARSFNVTNAGVLGALLDDNSEPISILQSSVGFIEGGKVQTKNFPAPDGIANDPTLGSLANMIFGHDTKAIPSEPNGPLYKWVNYNELTKAGYTIALDDNGKPFTSPDKEVTDIHELARSMSEQPLDFTDQYFPTRLITDTLLSSSAQLLALTPHANGITANPTVTVAAGDGLLNPSARPTGAVIAPGYNHLDVVTAAQAQNNGKPEVVSTTLANFVSSLP